MESPQIVELFVDISATIRAEIDKVEHRGLSGVREGQYTIDVAADSVAVRMLDNAGLGVLSEESGAAASDRDILVVVDPIDGSTNADAGLPWFATSLCAVDADGPLVAVVVNQATGQVWHAIRGEGAYRDGQPISPSRVAVFSDAFVTVSGLPPRHLGWRQFRCYGAAALDLCAVADGTFDAFIDMSVDAHGVWDYLGGLLICAEAGAQVVDVHGRDLLTYTHDARRTPVATATESLLSDLLPKLGDDAVL